MGKMGINNHGQMNAGIDKLELSIVCKSTVTMAPKSQN